MGPGAIVVKQERSRGRHICRGTGTLLKAFERKRAYFSKWFGANAVEQELFFSKHPGVRDPYFSKWFDQGDPNFRLDLRGSERARAFGQWLDRHIEKTGRAKALVRSMPRTHG